MGKPLTWILVADAGRATIYEAEGGVAARDWTVRREMSANLPASRDIASDRPGRSFDSGGEGRHAMEPPTDPHRHAKEEFARDVAEFLDDGRRHNRFAELVVAAAPAFLGDLRGLMPSPLRSMVGREISKDYAHLPQPELRERLREAV